MTRDRRPVSHTVTAPPAPTPEVERAACQACGSDCTVVREGTPGFGAWTWLRCTRCRWNDRPRTDEHGDGLEPAQEP